MSYWCESSFCPARSDSVWNPYGQSKFPIETYQELPDPSSPSDKDWAAVTNPQISWGTIDTRYAKHRLPQLKKQQLTTLKGWRGERVNAQAVVWTGH